MNASQVMKDGWVDEGDRGRWMQTYLGIRFHPTDPVPEEVKLIDVAHALAQQCRFNGHTAKFWSVAEHSILCANLATPEAKRFALFHDAAEAYVGDMIRPLKYNGETMGEQFQDVEAGVMHAVNQSFGLVWTDELHTEVDRVDNLALAIEGTYLMRTVNGVPEWVQELIEVGRVATPNIDDIILFYKSTFTIDILNPVNITETVAEFLKIANSPYEGDPRCL